MSEPFRPDPPVVIGLLGGVAAGKSAVAGLFGARGLQVVDADAIAREVLAEPRVQQALRDRFGAGIAAAGGDVDREALARLAFSDPRARADLEAITHPAIRARIEGEMAAARRRGRSVLLDAPLLLEGGLIDRCDLTVFVDAPPEVRRQRAAARGWDEDELARREAAQAPLAVKRARADATIRNDVPLSETARQVDALLEGLSRRSGPRR